MFVTETNPATIANLWQRLRAMMERAGAVVGALPALAVLIALTPARQREIASTIALLEAIVRKLILFAAAEIRSAAKPRRTPLLAPVTQLTQTSGAHASTRTCAFDAAHPETWRVRFKLAPPRDPRSCPASRAPRIRALWGPTFALPQRAQTQPRHLAPAPLRLALRFEALRRVIADPAPHARRLARVLSRLYHRFRDAAEHYAIATTQPHSSDKCDPRLIIEAMAVALCVAPVFVNSG